MPTISLPLLSTNISYPVPCDDNKLQRPKQIDWISFFQFQYLMKLLARVPEQNTPIARAINVWIVLPFGHFVQPYPCVEDKTVCTGCRPLVDVQHGEAVVAVLNVDKLGTDILVGGHILQRNRCQRLFDITISSKRSFKMIVSAQN